MEHWVEIPPTPSELTLAWRAPESAEDRNRWAVGILSNRENRSTFRYLEGEEFQRANLGRSYAKLVSLGYRGYPTFERRKSKDGLFVDGVMEAFLRRLPPAHRSDFSKFLEFFRYRGDTLAPMSLLALTSARLPGDGFSLVDRLDPSAEACDLILEITGFRHRVPQASLLMEGMPLSLVAEPTNRHDPDAVRVDAAGTTIGYVNRLQSTTVAAWLRTRVVSCWLVRRNGRPESPVAFAFLRMRRSEQSLAA